MCILLASAVGFPIYLHCLHVSYHGLKCTLHVYKPNVRPVAGRSLFLNILVMTHLLKEYTLLASANPFYPTTRLRLYFSKIFAADLHVYMLQ